MTPHQGDETKSRVAADVSTNKKDALVKLAHSRSDAYEKVSMADLVRDALDEYLSRQDDLPEEARDDLDADLVANAGGEES